MNARGYVHLLFVSSTGHGYEHYFTKHEFFILSEFTGRRSFSWSFAIIYLYICTLLRDKSPKQRADSSLLKKVLSQNLLLRYYDSKRVQGLVAVCAGQISVSLQTIIILNTVIASVLLL